MNDLRERSDVENVLGRVEDWSEIVCGTDMNWNDPQTLSYLLALEEEIREEALWELFEQGRNPDWEEYFYSLNH
ncbi:hypothetical protein AGDE_12981 [Angomonas deanei]|uniref:Uncharacterized protein n=1 Tax=Angomonas deanei TaxID=59799 RepID=A0A7G2C9K3_9TRYP|nr:hypothetical protein AGDE_12981 [Angomonas deanei]CAD2216530.1 hypothetical protein, conserved [Angomonas deanei]|eukprot:EPY23138.1 hypothetical protein AGDE_12981 [Angomonas deanei]